MTTLSAVAIGHTSYSHSPIIAISNYRLALTADGNIYRALAYAEAYEACDAYNVAISEATAALIAAEGKHQHSGTPLARLVTMQRILQQHGGYCSYNVQDEPLHALNVARYYDILAIQDRSQLLAASKKDNARLREEMATIRAALAFVIAFKSNPSLIYRD